MYVGDSPVIPTLASLQYLCTPLANLVSGIHPRSCFLNRPLAFLGLTMDQNPSVISEGPRAGPGAAFLLAYGPANNNWPLNYLLGTVPVVLGLMANGILERNLELLCAWARPLVLAWGAGLALRGTGTLCWGCPRQESRAPAASRPSIS